MQRERLLAARAMVTSCATAPLLRWSVQQPEQLKATIDVLLMMILLLILLLMMKDLPLRM